MRYFAVRAPDIQEGLRQRNYLRRAVLARVGKREVNTNVTTIHRRPLIIPKITAHASRPSSSRSSLNHIRRLALHKGRALFKRWLATALAEKQVSYEPEDYP
jgi:hypothetical protein